MRGDVRRNRIRPTNCCREKRGVLLCVRCMYWFRTRSSSMSTITLRRPRFAAFGWMTKAGASAENTAILWICLSRPLVVFGIQSFWFLPAKIYFSRGQKGIAANPHVAAAFITQILRGPLGVKCEVAARHAGRRHPRASCNRNLVNTYAIRGSHVGAEYATLELGSQVPTGCSRVRQARGDTSSLARL